MVEEDVSDDVGDPEMTSEDASEGEKASAQTVAASERTSKKALKAVKKITKTPKDAPRIPGDSDRHPRGAPAPTFKAMFDDYVHGMTPETLQEKYKLTERTMQRKLPELELAKRRIMDGLRQRGEIPAVTAQTPAQLVTAPQTAGQAPSVPSGSPETPPATPNPAVVPQNPPGTYTVPAVPADKALAVSGAGGASKTLSESVGDSAGERETTRWRWPKQSNSVKNSPRKH